MSNPKVSVCLATYNYADYLGGCIDSILSQSFADLELIICDNASTDQTFEVVASYRDARIRYFCHETNIGPHANFNFAIARARGEFIRTMCADDLLLPHVLADQVAVFEKNPYVGVVSCDMLDADKNLGNRKLYRFQRGYCSGKEVSRRALDTLTNIVGGPSNHMFRKAALPENPFCPTYKLLSDLRIVLLVLRDWDYASIDRPGVIYRKHGNSDTNAITKDRYMEGDNWYRLVDEWDAFSPESLYMLRRHPMEPAQRAQMRRQIGTFTLFRWSRFLIKLILERLGASPAREEGK